MLTFSLHREVKGNEYLALYDLLQLPASKTRVGFFEVELGVSGGCPRNTERFPLRGGASESLARGWVRLTARHGCRSIHGLRVDADGRRSHTRRTREIANLSVLGVGDAF